MLRAVTLSLILLATVATMLPAGSWLAEASRRAAAMQQAGARRHSRAWWRRYRARLRRRRALAADQRRRRWSLRRRPVSQSNVHLSLPETLRPAELPDVSPSSLASIATITEQVSAPAPARAILPAAVTQLAPPAATPASAAPTQAVPPPVLAHAPQQKSATNLKATSASTVAAKPAARVAAASAAAATPAAPAAQPRLASLVAPVPAPVPLARLTGRGPQAALLAKLATPAPATIGSDPRKFSALPAPHNWLGVSSTLGGEYKFSLRAADGRQSGVAVWSRINLPVQATTDRRNRALAGVPHASLRRTVIDRMVAEGGWVVNDFEREIAGQRVFVVVAQSEAGGLRRAWTYYFVEFGGQLFSLSTVAPTEFADAVASEAEQTLSALASRRVAAVSPQN